MFTKMRHICLAAFAVAVISCTQETPDGIQDQGAALTKIVNASAAGSPVSGILVKFRALPDEADAEAVRGAGAAISGRVFPENGRRSVYGLERWYYIAPDAGIDAGDVARALSAMDNVEAVEYDVRYAKASDCVACPYYDTPAMKAMAVSSQVFNDPFLSSQWNYRNTGDKAVAESAVAGADINVTDVWRKLTGGDSSIIVAVIDEGVQFSHPDLAANMWRNADESEDGHDDDGNGYKDDIHGYNFASDGPLSWNAENDKGHGTHCAGIIAAVNNNEKGVSGVAGGTGKGDGVRIMSCQIFDDERGGTPSVVAKAIRYAADNGASIISCSFGYTGGKYYSDLHFRKGNSGLNSIEYEAIMEFEATRNNDVLDGGIAIFAAGNDSEPYASYPGALNDIICVTATGPDNLPSYYTNYGPGCNIAAPGGEPYLKPVSPKSWVLSTLPTDKFSSGYGYMYGTSMACPHVSGIAALGLAYARKLGKKFTVKEFKSLLLASVNDIDTGLSGAIKDYGEGASATAVAPKLGAYSGKMGTGSADAWRFMMNMEGTPCASAVCGKVQGISLRDWFGSSASHLTYGSLEYSDEEVQSLALKEAPYIKNGKLYVYPTKCGSMRIKINAVGGGSTVGGDSAAGGMAFSRTVSIIVRPHVSDNGGWL